MRPTRGAVASSCVAGSQLTAYFKNDDSAEKALKELLDRGVPSSAVTLQKLESTDESPRSTSGSILTVDDPSHGTQILAVVQHYEGEIQVRHSGASETEGGAETATGTQTAGNP